MTIPNLISIGRLFVVPLIIWLIVSDQPVLAFWAFVLAGVSDGVDGFLARHLNMRSALGTYLDPLADKALLVSIYVTFSVVAEIPVWVTIMVVSRDVFIIGAVILAGMLGNPVEMRPYFISKVNTAAQIILASIVLADLAFAIDLSSLREIMVISVGILTVASALLYALGWVMHMGGWRSEDREDQSSVDKRIAE